MKIQVIWSIQLKTVHCPITQCTNCQPVLCSPVETTAFHLLYVIKAFSVRRKFTFDDKDLSDEDSKTELEEKQRLEALAKELAKLAKRQMSIISTIHGQRNILLALAAKAGVDTHEDDSDVVIWAVTVRSVVIMKGMGISGLHAGHFRVNPFFRSRPCYKHPKRLLALLSKLISLSLGKSLWTGDLLWNRCR